MQDMQVITRELINEMLTPEEEREWLTYTAYWPKKEVEEAREHIVSACVVVQALVRHMTEGAAPECEAVQKLLLRNNQLSMKYRLRERLAKRGEWNESIAKKVHALGLRLVIGMAAAECGVSESQVFDFCNLAKKASKWGQALEAIAAEAATLAERGAGAGSNAALALAERYIEVCEDHALGDPVVHARWFIEFGRVLVGNAWVPVDEPARKAWTLLIDAVDELRRPAGVRPAAAW
jgi:hypothetical protein